MKTKTPFLAAAVFVAASVFGLGVADVAAQGKAKATKTAAKCELKRGRGWAPTEAMARFQAWEIIAQTTGNVDAAIKNIDDPGTVPTSLNNIDRLVLDLPVPRTQAIPLSWSIVTN